MEPDETAPSKYDQCNILGLNKFHLTPLIPTRNILRWAALLGLIGLGLLYLNSTVFSLWAAGGPPTEVPKAWLHRALVHFGFTVALFATAIFAFKALKPGFSFKGKKILYAWLVIVAVAIGYPPIKKFISIDTCLDSGGKWSEKHFDCQR